jgi:hypothetical protein
MLHTSFRSGRAFYGRMEHRVYGPLWPSAFSLVPREMVASQASHTEQVLRDSDKFVRQLLRTFPDGSVNA